MKRFLTIAALCLFGSLPAKALILHSGESVTVGGLLPNFFDNRMYASINDSYTMQWITPYQVYSPYVYVSFDPSKIPYGYGIGHDYYDPRFSPIPVLKSYTVDLEFLVPENAYSIQIGWDGPGIYTAPQVAAVPEPSTWLMMLLGFAALGGLLQLKNAKRRVEIDRESLACR